MPLLFEGPCPASKEQSMLRSRMGLQQAQVGAQIAKMGMQKLTGLRKHLHRVHKLPIQCFRCYTSFGTQQALKNHLLYSSERMCEVIDEPPEGDEGFDDDQEKALKARRPTGQTDLEGWNDMWIILFPADSESEIPNPCKYGTSS